MSQGLIVVINSLKVSLEWERGKITKLNAKLSLPASFKSKRVNIKKQMGEKCGSASQF